MKRRTVLPLLLAVALFVGALAVPVWADSRTMLTVTVPIPGDVNGDGLPTSADLICLMKYLSGATSAPKYPDVNGDGVHDLLDLVRLMKLLAK